MQNVHLFNSLPSENEINSAGVEKPFKCMKSDLLISTNIDPNIHPKRHTIAKLFKCSKCQYSTMNFNNLRKHKLNNCSLEKCKTFRCHACDYVCHDKLMMNSHFFSTHTGSKILFQCTHCDFKTITINSLENHVQENHSTHLEYACTSCDFVSNSQKSIQTHMAEQHPDQLNNFKEINGNPEGDSGVEIDSFTCNEPVNFDPHHTMKHKVATAGDIYENGVDLKVEEQLMLIQTEDEINPCSNMLSSGNLQNIVSNSPEITTRNSFHCQHCDYSTINKVIFKRHLHTHINEKTYKCSYCGKCFTHKEGLMKHKRTHTGEKPFQCSHCDIYFAHKESLEEHQKIHTGKKSYQCSNCDKYFTHLALLLQHQITHTGEKPHQCSGSDKCLDKDQAGSFSVSSSSFSDSDSSDADLHYDPGTVNDDTSNTVSGARKCINSPNRFCYICGDYTPENFKHPITTHLKLAYKEYFNISITDQDKTWAPHIACKGCVASLNKWMHGKNKWGVSFMSPTAWAEPSDHSTDCYFCLTKIKGYNLKNRCRIKYPNIDTVCRPVPRSPGVPAPIPPPFVFSDLEAVGDLPYVRKNSATAGTGGQVAGH